MFDLDAIIMFLRTAEAGSFTAAARRCNVPLSTLSRRISQLEARLGSALLHRTTRRVAVTPAGQRFYDQCVRAEVLLEEAEQEIRAVARTPTGTLRILAPYALGLSVIEPALSDFRNQNPNVTVELTLEDMPLDPIEHGFDVAIRRGRIPDSGYTSRVVARGGAHLVASPEYLNRAGRPARPEDLAGHDVLANGRAGRTRWRLRHVDGGLAEVEVEPVLAANESTTLAAQSARGAGVALLAPQITRQHVARGELEVVLPGWRRDEEVDLAIVFAPKATRDAKVRAFVDHCADTFAAWEKVGLPEDSSVRPAPAPDPDHGAGSGRPERAR